MTKRDTLISAHHPGYLLQVYSTFTHIVYDYIFRQKFSNPKLNKKMQVLHEKY